MVRKRTQPIWESAIYGGDDYVIKSDYALDYAFIFHLSRAIALQTYDDSQSQIRAHSFKRLYDCNSVLIPFEL